MARSKPNALEALRKLGEERRLLDAREATLREEAAAELGRLLISMVILPQSNLLNSSS